METCSPSGPLAVEMTSYSKERTTTSWDMTLNPEETDEDTSVNRLKELTSSLKDLVLQTSLSLWLRTSGIVVCFLPVQDDKGWASLHCHHGEVGGGRPGWSCHICLTRFIFREIVEGGGNGTRFVRFLACLVDDVRCFVGRRRRTVSQHSVQSAGV